MSEPPGMTTAKGDLGEIEETCEEISEELDDEAEAEWQNWHPKENDSYQDIEKRTAEQAGDIKIEQLMYKFMNRFNELYFDNKSVSAKLSLVGDEYKLVYKLKT